MSINAPILLQSPTPNQPPGFAQKMSILLPLLNSPTNLNNVRDFSNVCRTCATITEFVMPIFSGEGLQNNLADKIKRHLPIQVQENDELPLVVCYQCSSTLLAWHELVKCSVQADAALRAKISSNRKTNPSNAIIKTSSSVEEETESKFKPEFSRPQAQPYRTCVYCATTHPLASYRKHLVVEHSRRLFHCEECDSFVDRKDFIVHMSFHALHYTTNGINRKNNKKNEEIASQNPSIVPPAPAPQCSPKTGSPQCSPKTGSPQCSSKTESPQLLPNPESPQCSSKTKRPQCSSKTKSPQCSSKTKSPQCSSKTESRQLLPNPGSLQCSSETESPQCSSKTDSRQLLPNPESPQCSSKTESRQLFPNPESLQCSSETEIIPLLPKTESPQCPIKTEIKPFNKTQDIIKPPVVVKTKTSVQENEFSDHSDMEGFEPLPESVFEAIEDSQDGQHLEDHTTHTPENQPHSHSDESNKSSQPKNNHLSNPVPSLENINKFNNCSVVIKPININNCAEMNNAIKNSNGNNNLALPANKTPPKTTVASTSDNHPTDKREKRNHQKTRKCPFCPKECRASSSYFYHLKYVHKESKEHECEVCGRRFNTKSCLTQHMATHAAQYEFECQQCQKQFKTKASLYIHEQTHSGKKSWSCSQCEKSFRWKTQLLRHMTRHAAEKGHVCDTCGRGFSVRSDLLRHARTHNAGNFTCDKCGQKFAQLRYLKVHATKQHSNNVGKVYM